MIDIAKKYCRQLGVNVSFHMPTGYKEAFGTYDVTCNTIYINKNLAQSAPPYRFLFFFLHEYRHAVQYNNPSAFSDEIQKSLPYVILYNGECFKLSGNSWQKCTLQGEERYFTDAYLSLPYETDANKFALEECEKLCPEQKCALQKLYEMFLPRKQVAFAQLQKIFDEIDKLTAKNSV